MWSVQLGQAIKAAAMAQCPDGYPVEMPHGYEFDLLCEAINQGIDSHLEAVQFTEFSGSYGKRGFKFNPETLSVLVRRLMESDNDEAQSLASGICETLNIELI